VAAAVRAGCPARRPGSRLGGHPGRHRGPVRCPHGNGSGRALVHRTLAVSNPSGRGGHRPARGVPIVHGPDGRGVRRGHPRRPGPSRSVHTGHAVGPRPDSRSLARGPRQVLWGLLGLVGAGAEAPLGAVLAERLVLAGQQRRQVWSPARSGRRRPPRTPAGSRHTARPAPGVPHDPHPRLLSSLVAVGPDPPRWARWLVKGGWHACQCVSCTAIDQAPGAPVRPLAGRPRRPRRPRRPGCRGRADAPPLRSRADVAGLVARAHTMLRPA
jgi:hypothetical protein